MFKKSEYQIKENMDKTELKRVLSKKVKRDLIELTTRFTEECSNLNLRIDATSLDQEVLVSRLWEILLYLKTTHPENYLTCINILSEEEEKDTSSKSVEAKREVARSQIIEAIKVIPFIPDVVCKHLFEVLSENQELKEQWRLNHRYLGFRAFLATNDISIPLNLEELLYNNIFKSGTSDDFHEASLINYGRYQLDIWEEDLKSILSELTLEEIDIILSLHLIYQWIVFLLEQRNEKISYNYDDIPLLKRVILAQYLKFAETDKCTDEDLNNLAEKINHILYSKINDSCIKILPWGDLD